MIQKQMAKRFHETEVWSQDWFIEMDIEYRILWFWVVDKCNHAGIWKPNRKMFEVMNNLKVDLDAALASFNNNKERVIVTSKGNWFLPDFFVFQYGVVFNIANRLHKSIYTSMYQEDIELTSIRGLKEVKMTSSRGQGDHTEGLKDKDKDKDKELNNSTVTELSVVNNGEKKFSENGHSEKMPISMKMKNYWMDKNPKYPVSDELDLPALVSIDKFIRQQLKNEKRINGDQFFGNKISDEESFDRWKLICGVVMRDKFYADKQLDLIAKKIQSFWIIVTKIVDGEINGTTGLPTKSY